MNIGDSINNFARKEVSMCAGEVCGDNRFEVIEKAKQHLLDSTNIHTSEDEMKALDSFLFRCWQMGWLKQYDDAATDWKKVKDDGYPRPIEGYAVSEFVLVSWQVALPDLGFPRYATVAQYDYGKMLWLDRDNKIIAGVTHWMPIVLPKGNDMTKKEIMQASMRQCKLIRTFGEKEAFKSGFTKAAEWMQDTACEWIKANMPNYVNFEEGLINEVDMADDFRKAMEGQK